MVESGSLDFAVEHDVIYQSGLADEHRCGYQGRRVVTDPLRLLDNGKRERGSGLSLLRFTGALTFWSTEM